MTDDDALIAQACEVMHDAYEAAAISEGWETQERSRKPWADVPEANKATMRIAVSALLAAVRDQIAADALREAAEASLLGQRGPRVSRDWLRDRADRLDSVSGNVDEPKCPECGEPREVPGEGRYCGDCEDYEGHCINDHCMTCGRST